MTMIVTTWQRGSRVRITQDASQILAHATIVAMGRGGWTQVQETPTPDRRAQ